MFVHSVWDEVCKKVSERACSITVDQILSQENSSGWIVLKHDIETNVAKALTMAKIESKHGIRASYYVQADLLKDNHQLLSEIAALGHEVTYHYDVMDANGGDLELAVSEFEAYVAEFKSYGFDVKTVCPHGNPIMIRNGWASNKDFFRDDNVAHKFPEILDMVVQLPTLLKEDYLYVSDAGYGWKQVVNIKDNDVSNNGDLVIAGDKEMLSMISSCDRLILSTHPHRWESSRCMFVCRLIFFKAIRFTARTLSKITFFKRIMSRFYHLAKKV